MPKSHSLYLMISRTPTKMGKFIRIFTRFAYNHVSLSLDPTLQHWVSFARYVRQVPLAGGFVQENAPRFSAMTGSIPVRIYRVELSESHYWSLLTLFAKAGNRSCGLIYNTLGALTTAIGIHFPLPGAYTCLEFAEAVLGKRFRSIRELDETLENRLIFEGDFKTILTDVQCEDDYFEHRGFRGSIWDTAVHFTRLTNRLIHCSSYRDPMSHHFQ